MFLTPQELHQLTGYKRRADQVKWLVRNGYRFNVNGCGFPIVATAEVERILVGGSGRRTEPNFAAING